MPVLNMQCLNKKNIFALVLSQMRSTQRVSVWPVGLVGGMKYERPVVEAGKVGVFYVSLVLFTVPLTEQVKKMNNTSESVFCFT